MSTRPLNWRTGKPLNPFAALLCTPRAIRLLQRLPRWVSAWVGLLPFSEITWSSREHCPMCDWSIEATARTQWGARRKLARAVQAHEREALG